MAAVAFSATPPFNAPSSTAYTLVTPGTAAAAVAAAADAAPRKSDVDAAGSLLAAVMAARVPLVSPVAVASPTTRVDTPRPPEGSVAAPAAAARGREEEEKIEVAVGDEREGKEAKERVEEAREEATRLIILTICCGRSPVKVCQPGLTAKICT